MTTPLNATDRPLPVSDTATAPVMPSWRAILIGALLIPLSTYFGNYAYVVVQALNWGQTSLLRGPIFVLFALVTANLLLRKFARKRGLQSSEMLIIYSMIAVSVCVSGFGQVQWLVNILPAGGYFASSSNHYERFLFNLPPFLVPHDPRVIADFYRGNAALYRTDILRDWAVPVVVWSGFLFVLCWVTLCLSALVRRQWMDQEKLTFPLVFLPLEMAQGGAGHSSFFKNKWMWGGFVIAGLLESVNYVHFFFPAFPYVPLKPSDWHLEKSLTTAPWNSMGTLTLAFYPFAIGIAFLLSLEVSFSCWFFYLMTRLENVLSAAFGLNAGGGAAHGAMASAPFLGEQGAGAFLAMGLFLLWNARHSFKEAFHSTWDSALARRNDDPSAPLSPRAALWGTVAGIAALTAFLTVVGLNFWVALLFWSVYLLFVLVLTRIYAEAGAGWAWGPMVNVSGTLLDGLGVNSLSARSLTVLGHLDWFSTEFRDTPMPHQMEALKLGQETQMPRRQMLWGLLVAAAISGFVAFWAYLVMYYHFGAASAHVRPILQTIGPNALGQINNWLNNPRPPDHAALGGMAGGAVLVLLLSVLRQRFVWWPLHPIGYVLAGTYSMEYMWCPFLIAWALKALTLRYGGAKLYRQCVPFFLGLILGDYIVPTLWGLWGTANHVQVYLAFPH